jgi:hypothetical protein
MKVVPSSTIRLGILCVGILLLHLVLLEVMARTRIIEKVMASQFTAPEFLLILAFLAARFASYFLVPAAFAAFVVSRLFNATSHPESK